MSPGTRPTLEWKRWYKLYKAGKLCDDWQLFCTYYADTGDQPDNYTLKRKNSRQEYSLINCYWGKVMCGIQKNTWASRIPLKRVTELLAG